MSVLKRGVMVVAIVAGLATSVYNTRVAEAEQAPCWVCDAAYLVCFDNINWTNNGEAQHEQCLLDLNDCLGRFGCF